LDAGNTDPDHHSAGTVSVKGCHIEHQARMGADAPILIFVFRKSACDVAGVESTTKDGIFFLKA
jgi:hypothetical protein